MNRFDVHLFLGSGLPVDLRSKLRSSRLTKWSKCVNKQYALVISFIRVTHNTATHNNSKSHIAQQGDKAKTRQTTSTRIRQKHRLFKFIYTVELHLLPIDSGRLLSRHLVSKAIRGSAKHSADDLQWLLARVCEWPNRVQILRCDGIVL